jgi:hypothetical protein
LKGKSLAMTLNISPSYIKGPREIAKPVTTIRPNLTRFKREKLLQEKYDDWADDLTKQ